MHGKQARVVIPHTQVGPCVCVWGGGHWLSHHKNPQTPTQVCTCVDWLLYYTHVHALRKAAPVHAMKGYGRGVEV